MTRPTPCPSLGVMMINARFLSGLTYRVVKKRFRVAWDTGGIAIGYAVATALVYLLRS